MTSQPLTPEVLAAQDAVVLVTDHTAVDYARSPRTPRSSSTRAASTAERGTPTLSGPESATMPAAGGLAGFSRDLAALTVIVGAFTAGAILAFPQMDDGVLVLLLKERGADGLPRASLDRPLVGSLWRGAAVLLGPEGFWRAGFAVHFLLWLALGLIACRLWRHLCPAFAGAAPVVGALTVAPIGVRTQLSTVTVTAICILSVVPAYAALLAALRFLESRRAAWLAAAVGLVVVAGLLTEYGVVAAVSAAVLLWFWPASLERGRRRLSALLLAGVSVASYLAYLALADFSQRPKLAPAGYLDASRWVRVPFNAATRFWDAAAGELGRSFANFDLQWTSRSSLLAAGFGLAVGGLLWWSSRPAGTPAAARPPRGFMLGLAAALAAGVLPIALLRPIYRTAFGSRFQIPILPIAAALTVVVLLTLARPEYHRLGAGLVGLLVGLAVVQESAAAVRQRQTMAAVGAALRPIVAEREGVTLAVLSDDGWLCHTAQVCTGMATSGWPVELGRRVWVETAGEAASSIGSRAACREPVLVGLEERGFERGAPDRRVVWVEVRGQRVSAEPFCVATDGGT